MRNKKRILIFLPSFESGGAENFVISLMESISDTNNEIALLCLSKKDSVYDYRLKQLNASCIMLTHSNNPIVRYFEGYHAFRRFLNESELFDIVHINAATGLDLPFLWISKRRDIKKRLLHCHSSSVQGAYKRLGHAVSKMLFSEESTASIACSKEAAKWLLSKKDYVSNSYEIIPNGIDCARFTFNAERRQVTRKDLKIADECFVISCIAKLNENKNQIFLIHVVKQLIENGIATKLLLIGDGDSLSYLQQQATLLEIDENVCFLGNRANVEDYLFASDAFALASFYEGLPYSVIEAQCAGLPCLVPSSVTKECAITQLVTICELKQDTYISELINIYNNENIDRLSSAERVNNRGFGCSESISRLTKYYEV